MMSGDQLTLGPLGLLLVIGSVVLFAQPIYGNPNCVDSLPDNTTGQCKKGCKFGLYGVFCNISCSTNCDAACSQITGNCLTGCDTNWYKSNCSRNCRGKCMRDICDIKTGECIHGCIAGYYGAACDKRCSENCTGGLCDEFGSCPCKKGAVDPACHIDCTDNCIDGQCAANTFGQPTCLKGCQPGRTGRFCQEWCQRDCHDEITHRRQTKRDLKKCNCTDGWTGQNCNIECPKCKYSKECNLSCEGGYYGDECHLNCSFTCLRETNGKPGCNKDTGYCHSGCLQGYYGSRCTKKCSSNCRKNECYYTNGSCVECEPLTYGPTCEDGCGQCINEQCDRNGTCRECKLGWFGLRCQHQCTVSCKSHDCRVDQRGKHICAGACVEGYTGADCSEKCPSGCSKCDRKNGSCPEMLINNGTSETLSTPSNKSLSPEIIAVIVLGVVAVVAFVVYCCIGILLVLRWMEVFRFCCEKKVPRKETTVRKSCGTFAQNTEEHDRMLHGKTIESNDDGEIALETMPTKDDVPYPTEVQDDVPYPTEVQDDVRYPTEVHDDTPSQDHDDHKGKGNVIPKREEIQ